MGEERAITTLLWERDQHVVLQSIAMEIDRKLAQNGGKALVWSLSEKKRGRSVEQNSKMWAMISHINNDQGWGISDTNAKNLLTAECFGSKVVNGHEVYISTSKMTVEQMSRFIEWMERYGAENGIAML